MAGGRILLTPEELVSEARSLKSAADTQNTVIRELDSIVNGLLSQWTGDAQREFVSSYNNKKKTFQKMVELMTELAKDITNFAQNMGSMEAQYTNGAKKLGA